MKCLENKTAVITGSTSGIGLEIARALAENGANIVINGFGDESEILKIVNEIEKNFNVKVLYDPADVSNTAEIENMIKNAYSINGNIDILVNNAGIQFVAPVLEFPQEKWDAILSINLSSSFKTTKLVLAKMLENNWGRIINIASAHGIVLRLINQHM